MEDIKKILEEHESRIKELEEAVFSQNEPIKKVEQNYKGLAGGITLLIDNKFLNEPRSVNEIKDELKREGYHHSVAPVSKMLSVNFTRNKKILNRIKENNIWKYVVRK